LSLKAGAKLKLLFKTCKKNLKKIETFFSSLIPKFSAGISMNFPCFAGCKCKKLFQFPQAFFELFFRKFLFLPIQMPAGISKSVSLMRVQK
ncbi:hypothetical protein, partial [Flavobacterium sp.]|uniref:hypothetical protein n=1 Tax=Flavobacterium sp. TaxID=239 RepID=UPI0031D5C5AA